MDMTRTLPALFAAAVVFSLPATASAQSLPIIIVTPSPGPGVAAPGWGWPGPVAPAYGYGYGTAYGCYTTVGGYPVCSEALAPTYDYATGLFHYPGYGIYPGYGYGYGIGPADGYYAYQP